jgi:hypothetical protein
MKMHVHCFGAFWLNVVVYNSNGSDVVGLHQGWWLLVAHLF